MKINYFDNVPYAVTKVTNHHTIKNNVLKLIDEQPSGSFQKISNTDWFIDETCERKYMEYILLNTKDVLDEIYARLNLPEYYVMNYWFQQYGLSDRHDWHTHDECKFANVYFVELPCQSVATQFNINDKVMSPLVSEGDILTFPSNVLHRSPINTCESRKTIVAFNVI